MNPLLTTKQETFRAGTDNLEFFRERLLKMNNGALMFCTRGEAIITIDLRKYPYFFWSIISRSATFFWP